MTKGTRSIPVTCDAADTADIKDIRDSQGDLAYLSEKNAQRLRTSLETEGITFAFSVWRDRRGGLHCLDGHARLRVLRDMRDEGYGIPAVPIVLVKARSRQHAMKKLLLGRSDYHKTTEEGLNEFIRQEELDFADVRDQVNFSEIDIGSFELTYINGDGPEPEPPAAPTLKTCPSCGYEF